MLLRIIRNWVSRKKKVVVAVFALLIAGFYLQSLVNIEQTYFARSSNSQECFCGMKQVINDTNAEKVKDFVVVNKTDTKIILNQIKANTGLNNTKGTSETRTKEVKKTTDKTKSDNLPNNYVDFKLVLPFIEPKLDPKQRTLYVAVVVNSAAKGEKHRNLRKAIRETWGSATQPQIRNKTLPKRPWKLFFSLGVIDDQTEHQANLKEAREYNDVIIGNFTDKYSNIVIKTFMAHFWAVTKLKCNYVLKTDDDVYVRVPGLVSWLLESGSPREFYGGMVAVNYLIIRDPNSELYISQEQYPGKYWPPWCHGSYHVLSSDIIPNYIIYTYKRKPFPTDDAYLGVVALDLGIKVVHIPGFTIEDANPRKSRSDKEMNSSLAIGHKITPYQMTSFHEYYKKYNLT